MTPFKRPMLAAPLLPSNVEYTDSNILAAMNKLRYPVLATLKMDGVRALRMNGTLLSRTLKPIPNRAIREMSLVLPGGFDMELYNPAMSYNEIQSIVMSETHMNSDTIQFHVLDWFGKETMYNQRMFDVFEWVKKNPVCKFYYPTTIHNAQELFNFLQNSEIEQCEGICFRTPNSPYKQGRSTLKEQYLVKLARFIRTEITIKGFEEQQENTNPDLYNGVGYMKRQTCADGMIGKNTLGAFICTDDKGQEVRCGTGVGLTDKLRKEIWKNRYRYINKQITVKFKSHGMKDVLRHPIFVGFREKGF
jgi:DNA ligase-1